MAFTRVQATPVSSVTGGANAVCSFASLPAAGNVVVVPVIMRGQLGNESVTVADNQGNTYHAGAVAAASNDNRAAIYYAYNIGVPSGTFTVTVTRTGAGGQQTEAVAIEVSGFGAADPLVGAGTNTGNSTTPSATTAATGVSEAFVVGCFAALRLNFNITSITVGVQAPAFFEEYEKLSSTAFILVGEADSRDNTSAGGVESIGWTMNSGINWSAAIIALNSTPPAAAQRLTQLARETLELNGTPNMHLTQLAREVLYPFTCSPGPTPSSTGCPDGLTLRPATGSAGCAADEV